MVIVNPEEFSNKFRDDLIKDLELVSSLCCPKCIITYVDGNYEGNCFYSDENGKELNCVYDFEDISMKEVINEWIYGVLKIIRKEKGELLAGKWKTRFEKEL